MSQLPSVCIIYKCHMLLNVELKNTCMHSYNLWNKLYIKNSLVGQSLSVYRHDILIITARLMQMENNNLDLSGYV